MKTKFLCTLALLLSLTIPALALDNSFATLYPENTSIFVEFNNTSTTNFEFDQTALYQMINDPQAEKFFSHTKKKLDEIFTMAAIFTQGLKPKDLLSAFSNHASIGIFTNGLTPELLLIAEFPEDVEPLKLLASFNPQGPNATEFSYDFPVNPENPNQKLFLKVKGQHLYISISTSVNSINSAMMPKTNSLGSSTGYLRASSQLGQNRLITIYTTPEMLDILEAINQQAKLEGDLSLINKDLFTSLAYGMCIEPPAFVQRYYIKEATIYTPYQLLSPPDVSQASFITTDALSFVTAGFDLEQAVGFIMEALILVTPESAALTPEERTEALGLLRTDIMNSMMEVQATYGINPITDIAENLGTDFTFCMQNTDRLPGLSMFGLGGSTIIAKSKDPKKLATSLNLAIDTVLPMLEDQVGSKLEIQTEFGTIRGLAFANSFTFCYIIVGDTVIFSLNPAAIDYTLAMRVADKSLLASPELSTLQDIIMATAGKTGITTAPVIVGGVEINGISDLLNNTVALGASIQGLTFAAEEAERIRGIYDGELPFSPIPNPSMNPPAFIKFLSEAFPIYLLPSKEIINKYVFDAWAASFITTEGELVSISYGPFPINNLPFSKIYGNMIEMGKFAAIGSAAESQADDLLSEDETTEE